MKKYVVVLNKESEKGGINNELRSLSSLEFIPNRECKTEDVKDTRCLYSFLTEDEAKELQKDPRVKSVNAKKPTIVVPMGFLPNSEKTFIFGKSSARIARPLPGDLESTTQEPIFIDTKNNRVIEREERKAQESVSAQSLDQNSFVENLPSGEGVDVVIVDGIISGRVSSIGGTLYLSNFFFDNNQIVHPEFLDEQGASRINLINWNSYVGEPGDYPYEEMMLDRNQFGNNSHGLHVAGIACGTNLGWAKKSAIYNMSPYTGDLLNDSKHLIALKNWHMSKGNSRPTVTNHSYGRQYPNFDVRYVNSARVDGVTYTAPRNDTGATATCSIDNGRLASFTVTNPGSGYTNPPTISFNGGGGDEAVAIMAQGSVKKITITNFIATAYDPQDPPTVTFSAPAQGVRAEGICEVNAQGKVSRIRMTNRGSGYTSPPTITFSGSSPPTAVAEIGSNFVTRIQVLNSVPNTYLPEWLCHWRGEIFLTLGDAPMLVLSGGDCVKEALWTITEDEGIRSEYYNNYGNLTDGIYEIAEKRVEISQNVFRQTLLGGEYGSTPDVSFTYTQGGKPFVGPHGIANVEGGELVSIDAVWAQDLCFGGIPESPGWFTSPPQVFITNGGGFTPSQLESWGFKVFPEILPLINGRGLWPRIAENIPAVDLLENSVIEDMIDSGVVVVGASGNSSYEIRRGGEPGSTNSIDVDFSYLYKANPSIPYEDNVPFPGLTTFTFYSILIGPWLDLGDNVYELDLKGGGPAAANGAISTGSLSWQCCPEKKADYSNTGTRIDLYAAGDQVTSCSYYGSTFDFAVWAGQVHAVHPSDSRFGLIKLSGTSMASPQVCGAVASALTQGYSSPPASSSPADITSWLKENAVSALADLPYPNDLKGGTDKLLHFPGVTVRD